MRTLLLALIAALPLALDRGPTPAVDDPPPPPFDCPFCGGDAQLHRDLTAAFARTQGVYLYAYLDRIF